MVTKHDNYDFIFITFIGVKVGTEALLPRVPFLALAQQGKTSVIFLKIVLTKL